MAEAELEAKPAAILYAEAAGDSGPAAHCPDLVSSQIETFGGKVVRNAGDTVVAEFASAIGAVDCAVDIQRALAKSHQEPAGARAALVCIGVHENAVAIAAGLAGLADAGGICTSRIVVDAARNKFDVGYRFLGEKTVAGNETAVPAYALDLDPESAGQVSGESFSESGLSGPIWVVGLAFALMFLSFVFVLRPWQEREAPAQEFSMIDPQPDKPSIAVLAFENHSEDASSDATADATADAIAESIIRSLSRDAGLFVSKREATFAYKGKTVKVQQIAVDLGVRFVLGGSVRNEGDTLHITTQLVDVVTGRNLWGERFERGADELMALNDEITGQVTTAMRDQFTGDDKIRPAQ